MALRDLSRFLHAKIAAQDAFAEWYINVLEQEATTYHWICPMPPMF
jgi:hypothetical protein